MIQIIWEVPIGVYKLRNIMDEETDMAAAFFRIVLSAAAVAITTSAQAQHHQPPVQSHASPSVTTAIGPGPFSAEVYGAFRSMMQKDSSPKVELGQAMSKGTNIAVGAASGLRAEITVVDGRPIISYGDECRTCPPPHAENATLLVTGRVETWAPPIELPNDLSGHALNRFIIGQANKAGLDMKQPFPIRIRGTLTNVAMHVIKSANPKFGGHGSAQPMALQEDIKVEKIDGEVIGFYAPEHLLGIITHPGEPFHYHWIDSGRTRTAHLDAFGMAKGAQLILPKN
ncbi:MAG: acetolactate decarboxylase [Xanthobacteraceae bacterium]